MEPIIGTEGADTLAGTAEDDVIRVLGGRDFVQAGAGDDEVRGGAGDDRIEGGEGDDDLFGAFGGDVVLGLDGDDNLSGGADDDLLLGGDGDDDLSGGTGGDVLDGEAGDDDLDGGDGADILLGGAGDDVLTGGDGDDELLGGAGEDVFVFGIDDGDDVVTDFDAAQDVVRLVDAPTDFFDVRLIGEDTVIRSGFTEVVLEDTFAGDVQTEFVSGEEGAAVAARAGSDLAATLGSPQGALAIAEATSVPDPIAGAPGGSYNIDVVFTSEVDDALVGAFQSAANVIGGFITQDEPQAATADGTVIDDLRLEAEIAPIDGPGQILGGVTPTELRDGSFLPSEGLIQFDEVDLQQLLADGLWFDTVLHEMLHTVGVGTIWEELDLLETVGGTLRFVGENAIAAYEEVFPEIAADDPFSDQGVPVEEEFGPGTALSHWDEETFGDDEIMTGFIGAGSNALTDLTIASVEDLGYATTFEDTPLA